MMDLTGDMSPQEAQMAQALHQFNQQLRQMMEKLCAANSLPGEPATPGTDGRAKPHGRPGALPRRMARRMMQALKFNEVRDALKEMMKLLQQMGMSKERLDQMRQLLKANQQAMQDQMSRYAGQRIAENMSETERQESAEGLLDLLFGALLRPGHGPAASRGDRASPTACAAASRCGKKRQGTANLTPKPPSGQPQHGGAPVELRHRNHRLKPKLVVICDISTSMRHCSELMLALVYALQDLVTKTTPSPSSTTWNTSRLRLRRSPGQ